jgi:hypothetical protein
MSETANLEQSTGIDSDDLFEKKTTDIRPTLFIGVGGTGMEVLLRVRRKILNHLWGSTGDKTRIGSLAEFPAAQFIHFDLDMRSVNESGNAQVEDLQYDLVKFSDEEKIVESFDMAKYSRDDDALDKYPNIKEWLSLTPKKIRELGIDPGKGAGQIRAISRLYFFDKYTTIRDKIRIKLKTLKAGLDHESQLTKLGLKLETTKSRIVIVGSVAGGTGSGTFLDMGWLSRWLAHNDGSKADVELMLFLPSGYNGANKERTEANAYSALMELESAMRGNKEYVGRWDKYDDLSTLDNEPFNDVFLLDTGNMAQQHTKNIKDIYHIAADALFEDFSSVELARTKSSRAVNQNQHKNALYEATVPASRFKEMKLSYSKRYSSFGQSAIDTRLEAKYDQQAHVWAGEMLKAFFGVGASDSYSNKATNELRDEYMANFMFLKPVTFSDFPKFSERVELKRSNGDFIDYVLVDQLLQDRNGLLLAGVEQTVSQRIDSIRSGFDRREWNTQVRDAVKQLENDAVRDVNATADAIEDRVTARRKELGEKIKKDIRNQLYVYLDNKEKGGLELVLSLVEQIKDRLEATGRGLISALKLNSERYIEIKETVRTKEFERLLKNLEETKGGLFTNAEKQAMSVMEHIRVEVANGIKFHLRAKAANEAALLMQEISNWLGKKTGLDNDGKALWTGLVGELQSGRDAVIEMMAQLDREIAILKDDLKKEHATLIYVPTNDKIISMPSNEELGEWAEDAFKGEGGSKAIFEKLSSPESSKKILSNVRSAAANELLKRIAASGSESDVDPLIEALGNMTVNKRKEIFNKFLKCGMPWVDANFDKDFKAKPDFFKCFIGVPNVADFTKRFKHELEDCIPFTGITLDYVNTGLVGRIVCYNEFSGLPLTVLRGIEGWRTSYRQETKKIPLHTHIDSTQFNHPIEPSTGELNRLAEDFKYYLLAIILGILNRDTKQILPPHGQYGFALARGDIRRIGNEKSVRQNGLDPSYKDPIVAKVQDQLNEMDITSLSAVKALCSDYEQNVYKFKLVPDENGVEHPLQGFASAIANEAGSEISGILRKKGVTDSDLKTLEEKLYDRLKDWSEVVPSSDSDAYLWEINSQPRDDGLPRLKSRIKNEFLMPGKIESLLNPNSNVTGIASAISGAISSGLPVGTPPPLPTSKFFHLAMNNQQLGVFNSSQISSMIQTGQIVPSNTKAWSDGFPGWLDFTAVPELMALLNGGTSMPPPLP